MNKYLVVYKVINHHSEETLNDIIENEKLNEDLFSKIYNQHFGSMVCILNIIKLDD